VELIRGGGGIFDVCVDGERIYSKSETGRFPAAAEILERLGR
jgi:selT/selW/selH-like putative selenoprotein